MRFTTVGVVFCLPCLSKLVDGEATKHMLGGGKR